MRIRCASFAGAAALLLATGCAYYRPYSMGGEPRVPEAIAHPRILLAQAEQARDRGDPELAYRYLALIRILHPESPESAEAFPEAIRLFKYLYNRDVKHANWDSVWVTSEPYFVFQWLGDESAGEEFPQETMDRLFVRSSYGLFRLFQSYSANRAPFRQWDIRAQDDNGTIESVTAAPRSG